MTQPGIKPQSPGLLANTLPTGPMSPVYKSDQYYIKLFVLDENTWNHLIMKKQ